MLNKILNKIKVRTTSNVIVENKVKKDIILSDFKYVQVIFRNIPKPQMIKLKKLNRFFISSRKKVQVDTKIRITI